MKKTVVIAIVGLASVASADVLLEVDLSVADTITITATDGLSAGTVSGNGGVGFLMADFFSSTGIFSGIGVGTLSSAANAPSSTPFVWSDGSSVGLNIWGFTGIMDFASSDVAFSGSTTFELSAADYAEALAGNSSGNIYAPAASDSGIPTATFLGTWNVVPAPGSMALLGLGGIVAGRRRR